jgi:predicted choloylglycine hydrolase
MGVKYGTALREHGFKLEELPGTMLTFAKVSEIEVKRVFPEILDEIHGFADASGTSYEHLLALILGVGAFKPPEACSVFAVSTGSHVLVGRNYDFYYRFKDHLESYFTKPSNGFSSIGDTDIFVGREDGVNEKGLAVAMAVVKSAEVRPGINFALLVRYILDKCASVREATNVLTSAHHVSAYNYLLADKEGDVAVVEACPTRVKVRKPYEKHAFLVCTNQFMHPDMYDLEKLGERPSDSMQRYVAISEKIQQLREKVTVREAQRILSDHAGLVCSHREEIQLDTLWSTVTTMKKPLMYRAEGHPCRTRYKIDRRLNRLT